MTGDLSWVRQLARRLVSDQALAREMPSKTASTTAKRRGCNGGDKVDHYKEAGSSV